MAAPVIVSVRNTPADGLRVVVTLQAAPTGTLSFFASKTPGSLGDAALATVQTAPTVYTVTIRATATFVAIPYYLTARDDEGDSEQECEWVCQGSNTPWGWQFAEHARDALWSHRKALARAAGIVQQGETWPDGRPLKMERIIAGPPAVGSSGVWPVIAVIPREREEWFAVPYGRSVDLYATIYCYAQHQTPVVWESVLYFLGNAIARILNQREHERFTLPCGMLVDQASVDSLTVSEEELGDRSFVIGAVLEWVGQGSYQYDQVD